MDIEYHAFGTINRTVSLGGGLPVWGRLIGDLQQKPPWGWCERCGKEVYRVGERVCEDCREQ